MPDGRSSGRNHPGRRGHARHHRGSRDRGRHHRDRPPVEEPTWTAIVASYALLGAIPVLLWVYSHPVAGSLVLSGVAGLYVVGQHVSRLVRCLRDCREFAFSVGETARITISRIPAEEPR